jgi:ATP-binding cassette subfamily B protein
MTGRGYADLELYRRLFREARPYWPHLGCFFLLNLLATPITLLTPLPLAIGVDSVVGSKPPPGFIDALLPASATNSKSFLIAFAALLFVAVAFLDQAQKLTTSVLGSYVGEQLTLRFRARLFTHVQRLSLAFHDNRGTADSVYRIQYDATSIQQVAIYGVMPFVTCSFMILAMVYVTARNDLLLAGMALAIAPAIIFVSLQARHRLRGGWREAKVLESGALAVVQEVLTGLRVVKAFGREDREQERFVGRAGEGTRKRIHLAVVDGLFTMAIGLTTAVGTAAVLYVGLRHVQSGQMTLGDLVLIMGYLAQLYVPVQTISKSLNTLQNALASAERAFSVLEERHDVLDCPDARTLKRASGAVEFDGVSFAYDSRDPVLQDVTFAVPAGSRLGIAGATGAGKTTLTNLLMRFYDPTAGWILLDGVDIRDYKVADLRNQFAIVLQEPVLFSTSIAENIAYARPSAGKEAIAAAARAANVHEFIAALPDGYATLVGERGMRLSGGERQRVSLARAFLKDAPILILDEPTSAVDVKTEAEIMRAMERLMADRTTIMIAHRLSTLENCQYRMELDHGGVVTLSETAVADERKSVPAPPYEPHSHVRGAGLGST